MINIASLVAHTVPTLLGRIDYGTQDFIAYCARVSNPANQNNTETSGKLLKYLIKNKHWSPFEMAHATIEIVTTRDIARQILRHRSFSFQEFSQRYAEAVEFSEPKEARIQDKNNRQNSLETNDTHLQENWERAQLNIMGLATTLYQTALRNGIAKEVARVILPEGLTISKLYMAGSLRSWYHYVELRSGNGTQKEHREVALACKRELAAICPILFGDSDEHTN